MWEARRIDRARSAHAGGFRFAWLLTACLLACNSGSGKEAPWIGRDAGEACVLGSDCRKGLQCDPSRQICVCTEHAACPGETFCHPFTGRCVDALPGCADDGDCPLGRYCDRGEGICRVGATYCQACSVDEQCIEPGARCLDGGFCGRACAQDRDCGDRARCQGGQCVPGLRCSEIDGRRTGHCVDACESDADCVGEGERCELALGLCRPAIGCDALVPCVADNLLPCARDADCVHGVDQVCEQGICVARHSGCAFNEACDPVTLTCVPSCREDSDCRLGRSCIAGACHPRHRCQRGQHNQCPQGMVCACPKGMSCSLPGEGECRPACATNEDCPLRHICVESFGRRVCEPGCEEARDCGPEERCTEHGTCVAEHLACKFTALCPTCTFCLEGVCQPGAAPYCAPCEDDSTCGEGGVCLDQRCAPGCGAGCPNGFGCSRFADPEDSSLEYEVCLPLDGSCDTECT